MPRARWLSPGWWAWWAAQLAGLAVASVAFWLLAGIPIVQALFNPSGILVSPLWAGGIPTGAAYLRSLVFGGETAGMPGFFIGEGRIPPAPIAEPWPAGEAALISLSSMSKVRSPEGAPGFLGVAP